IVVLLYPTMNTEAHWKTLSSNLVML
ncbi:MAG: hypothetical protein QOD25_4455, partial [Alphaproteobacteria bacterium]|nr:hypothetical protein [Alphaproteobacteria bacterium]